MQYYFTDAKEDSGFFAKIKAETGANVTLIQKFKQDGNVKRTRPKTLNGNLLPDIHRLYRPQWDDRLNMWKVDAMEEELTQWAKELGATDKDDRLINIVKVSNRRDPFLTGEHCKIQIDDNYLLDDETVLGKLHKAILRARNDIDFGDNDLTQYDRKHNVVYKANELGGRAKPTKDYHSLKEKMNFYTALNETSLARKVMMVERLGIHIEGVPEESQIDQTLVIKYEDEGNMKVTRKNTESRTNKEMIDAMMAMDDEELEILYYLHKAHSAKIFFWNSEYSYYEFQGVNLGRKLNEVEAKLMTSEMGDVLHRIINEIKNREKVIQKEISKGKGKKK